MPNYKLQLRISIEHSAQNEANNMHRSFDVPAPAWTGQHLVHYWRKPAVRCFDHRLWRLGWMKIDRNVQRFSTLEQRVEKLIIQIAAPMVTVDNGAFEAVPIDHALQFVSRFVRTGGWQRGEAREPRGMFLNCCGQKIIGIERHAHGI